MDQNYSSKEEKLNVASHGLGVILSILALVVMLLKSTSILAEISSLVFGLSLVLLYSSSTIYHASTLPKIRRRFRVLDHAMIYVLIAGTYTPVCLITLQKSVGTTLLIVIWAVAFIGVFIKLFFTGKFNTISTVMYVMMGWIAIFAVKPLFAAMNVDGLLWLLYGGVFYTVGAFIYSFHRIPYNHALFHCLVLAGSISHFVMIYFYVLN